MTETGDTLALWALIVSVIGTMIALAALAVAYLDWRQVGMESPWKFTAVGGGMWLLERIHRKPAAIRRFEYQQMCSSLQITAVNAAGIPLKVFRRGETELISVSPATSTETLTIVYKEYSFWDRLKRKIPKQNRIYTADSFESVHDGYEKWQTPVYPYQP